MSDDKSDLLFGVKAIADHLKLTERMVEARVASGDIPTFRSKGRVCTTKSGLAEHFAAKLAARA